VRLFTIIFLTVSIGVNAQTATNFNINDIDGINRDLFTELDNGNVVVLKFFTNWCSICNSTADEVNSIYNAYQTNSDPVVFWALDRDQNETNVQAATYRNNNSIPYPVIGEAYSVAQQFGVQYQPEYYIIRPDRSYVMRTNYTAMQTAVNEALASISTGISDVDLKSQVVVLSNAILWNTEASNSAEIKVVDMSGRTVFMRTINGKQKVELGLPSGVYIYTLTAGNKSTFGKIGVAN